jgi:hypothetical protein
VKAVEGDEVKTAKAGGRVIANGATVTAADKHGGPRWRRPLRSRSSAEGEGASTEPEKPATQKGGAASDLLFAAERPGVAASGGGVYQHHPATTSTAPTGCG